MKKFYELMVEYEGEISSIDMLEALRVLVPVPCPFPFIRIGHGGDGTYLLPDDLLGIAACISPGVNNRKFFEDELADRFGILSHMCDFSSDVSLFKTPMKDGMQTFRKLWLDTTGAPESISLAEIIDLECPDSSKDLLLQIDIEGAEYRNILATDDSVLRRFRIIAIELHGLQGINNPAIFHSVLKPFLAKLGSSFHCVHIHPNNCCGSVKVPLAETSIPRVLEATFLRKDRFVGFEEASLHPVRLPHPQDVGRNVSGNPLILLDEFWTGKNSEPLEFMKLLQDELEFCRERIQMLAAELDSERRALTSLQEAWPPPSRVLTPPSGLSDLAPQKRFVLSRGYGDFPDSGVVQSARPFFFHTAIALNPHITIDLDGIAELWRLEIENRTDSCHDRARLLYVTLTLDHGQPNTFNNLLPVSREFLTKGHLAVASIDFGGILARYVKISSPLFSALHFSAVRIIGRRI